LTCESSSGAWSEVWLSFSLSRFDLEPTVVQFSTPIEDGKESQQKNYGANVYVVFRSELKTGIAIRKEKRPTLKPNSPRLITCRIEVSFDQLGPPNLISETALSNMGGARSSKDW
jgi:hypothetical protein